MDIAGKVFIVTGAASGLGEGAARMLAAAGAKVVVADLQVERGRYLPIKSREELAAAAGRIAALARAAGV